jgi:hypothetical protein
VAAVAAGAVIVWILVPLQPAPASAANSAAAVRLRPPLPSWWTLVILGYRILIGLFYYFVLPEAMRL